MQPAIIGGEQCVQGADRRVNGCNTRRRCALHNRIAILGEGIYGVHHTRAANRAKHQVRVECPHERSTRASVRRAIVNETQLGVTGHTFQLDLAQKARRISERLPQCEPLQLVRAPMVTVPQLRQTRLGLTVVAMLQSDANPTGGIPDGRKYCVRQHVRERRDAILTAIVHKYRHHIFAV